ncbi:MAG TPA: DUF899 family protein [Pseudonocardia sp.]|uniref:DUF899 family protein n=1 Tax=Pseudonocardia sp. TaxID=60912 RepID=UPI002F3F7B1F
MSESPGSHGRPVGAQRLLQEDDGQIFHTYSAFGRGSEELLSTYVFLDLTPKGRDENGPNYRLADWVRPHDMYGKGGAVEGNGRYHSTGQASTESA